MFSYTEETFRVTQEFIDIGIYDNPEECAVAQAARNHFNYPVEVQGDFIRITVSSGYKKEYMMTHYLQEYVRDFDNDRQDVEPIEIVLYRADGMLWAGRSDEDL